MKIIAAIAIALSSLVLSAAAGVESAAHPGRPLMTATAMAGSDSQALLLAARDSNAEQTPAGECSIMCTLPAE